MPSWGWDLARRTASSKPSRLTIKLALVTTPCTCPSMIPALIAAERPRSSALTTSFFIERRLEISFFDHRFGDLHRVQRRAFEQLIARDEKHDRAPARIADVLPD